MHSGQERRNGDKRLEIHPGVFLMKQEKEARRPKAGLPLGCGKNNV